MNKPDFKGVGRASTPIICPHCGGSDHEDNRISERIYEMAAEDTARLRHEGRLREVVDILSALYAVRIANYVRHPWRCLDCGVRFDG